MLAAQSARLLPDGWLSTFSASANAGLRHLRLTSIPADLTCLTQLTRFDALVWPWSPRPMNLGPVAALPSLRHLRLLDESFSGRLKDDIIIQERQQLMRLSTLTSLTQLRVALGFDVSELPALPALRSLRCRRAQLHDRQLLSSCPQLTELDILAVTAAPEQQAAPPCLLPQLQRAVLGRLGGVVALAPHLRHLTCPLRPAPLPGQSGSRPVSPPQSDMFTHALSQLSQLRSLYLPGGSAGDISRALQQAVAQQCTRLVLRICGWDLALLPACRAMHTLELQPMESDSAFALRAVCWLAAMQDSSVREFVCYLPDFPWITAAPNAWLPLLAGWRSLRRLVLHSRLIPGSLQALAAACARRGSPLTRIELRYSEQDQVEPTYEAWMRGCGAACASVERAHPAITCIAVKAPGAEDVDAYVHH